ncbi:MAG TPA: outer membrane lipoprotein carrier protein LolA [Thermoanaerobaculia bacterium]|jgi:outer membrane lipoprotein-sorting protein|nr:outer membrane lipoprotein carrier protein LolA [Thermoanaerobaculia bacterium]
MSRSTMILAAIAAAAMTLPCAARTDPNSLDEVVRHVQEQQKNTRTLEADFRQEKTLALLARPEVSTGHFTYSRPNSVLWRYDSPKRVDMLIANGTMTTYYPDLNRAEKIEVRHYQDRIFRYMGASGALDDLATYFDFTFINRDDQPFYVLDLTPKSKSIARRVRHITIWIDRKSYLTTKFEYTEGDGDLTRYEFTHIRINQPIEQGRFTLNIPPTVRVEQMKLQ